MAEKLRSFYSNKYINYVVTCLVAEVSAPASEIEEFILSNPWDEMALKERMSRLTGALVEYLPDDYKQAIIILKDLLSKVSGGKYKYDDMLSMFIPDYVLECGMDDWETSLEALGYFTTHGTSSEFAIRPFIIADQDRVMKKMLEWASHEHPHMRRFASEGCRPRLPWSMALPALKHDPSPIMPILQLLRQDESKFVQKSVANNLNDITKDNPEVVIKFAKKYLGSNKHTDWIIKHGCRTLLKQGNREILRLFGVSKLEISVPNLILQNNLVTFGNSLQFSFVSEIVGKLPDKLRLEYAVDFMKANGKTSRKIFKISERKPTNNKINLTKTHKFINYTTRKHYPGRHAIAIIVNGEEVAQQEFKVVFE
jgi:3-methyladenine DNA glycosylase AlkC